MGLSDITPGGKEALPSQGLAQDRADHQRASEGGIWHPQDGGNAQTDDAIVKGIRPDDRHLVLLMAFDRYKKSIVLIWTL
jgi:hypothetical protein